MTDLQHWLDRIGLGRYAELLASHGIDFETLLTLDERDVARLGLAPEDDANLIRAITQQRAQAADAQPSALHALAGSTAPVRAERRHLTALFCDLVGSTALSVRLDPEDFGEILREFQARCEQAIARYDGRVVRQMGDGVLACFGFPTAHEDDAERAVNAALEMLRSISGSPALSAHGIEIRVGITSGLVIAGDFTSRGTRADDIGLVGEAPHLAAHLQQLAQPNQILIGPRARALLGRSFEFEDMGERQITGIKDRVHVWRVVGPAAVTTRFEARQSSHLTPLVGRKPELSILRARYDQAASGSGQLVLVSGEPGIGKSRLIAALREELADKANCAISAQCSSYHTTSAWHPIIRHLEDAAGIARDMAPAAKLEKLEALLVRHLAGQESTIVPLIAGLLSIPVDDRYPKIELTPQQQKSRTFAALLGLLEARTRDQPVLLVFEDVHWIDPTSLELVEQLRDRVADLRMLVVLLARPEFTLSHAEQPHITTVTIDRLGAHEAAEMIELLAEGDAMPAAMKAQIVARTDGVPLFVEEMTKAVIASGKASDRPGATVASPLLNVPDSLHESLMARLDQFAAMKSAAQAAAVIGREFSLDLLEAVASMPKQEIRVAVDRLLDSGLLFRGGQSNGRTYAFSHALVQDEAYASLLREERRELHVKIADALRRDFAELAESAPELVAHHYSEAGEARLAIEHWQKAGQQASKRSAFVEAATQFRLALKLLGDLPAGPQRDALELPLQHSLASALIAVKGFGAPDTNQAFRRARELCGHFPDSPQTFAVFTGIVGVHIQCAELGQALELAEDLLARAERQQDTTPKLLGHRGIGMSRFLMGDLASGCNHLRTTLELYDPPRHAPLAFVFSQDFKATAQAHLALATLVSGDIAGGIAHARQAAAHAEAMRHPHSLCYALPFLAGAHIICGEPGAAVPIGERTMTLAEEYGFPLWLAGGRLMRGWARASLGEGQAGLADIRASFAALEAIGTQLWVQFARYVLAQALAEARQTDATIALIDQAVTEIGPAGRWYEADLHRLKGDVLASDGSPAAAECSYQTAVAVAARQGARLWHLRAANRLGALWHAQGRAADAQAMLTPVCTAFGDAISGADLRQAKALLAELA